MEEIKDVILSVYREVVETNKQVVSTNMDVLRLAKIVQKKNNRQRKFNRGVAFFAMAAAVNFVYLYAINDIHNDKLNKLSKEVEELKKQKGV